MRAWWVVYAWLNLAGRPVVYERTGKMNPHVIMATASEAQLMDMHIHVMELLKITHEVLSKDKPKRVRGHTAVFDLDGLSLWHMHMPAVHMFNACVRHDQEMYPESLANLFVVNAPRVFHLFFSLVKPLLHRRTLEKIHILGADYRTELTKHIPPENIVEWLGGECKDCAEGCLPLPEAPGVLHGAQQVSVSAGGEHIVRERVDAPGHEVALEFSTEGGDISFSATWVGDDGASDTLVTDTRVNSHLVPVSHCLIAPGVGHFELRWSNAFSYLRGKTLHLTLVKSTGSRVEVETVETEQT
mmetsp:Transcript_43653/g.94749  ORF Transcript_43653/g.94749 Transcript_43653/m.94749 type:complete len:300 (+) Transcript_43653:390-1289(+)